jgi:serine/threonine-protein kinase
VASRYLNKTRKIVVQRTVGNYRLLKVIGEGANGIVYLCQDVDSGLIYAMKMLRMKVRGNDDSEKQSAIENFINESTAISQINHPNIINFIEFGYRRSGKRATPYIVMEYFKGKSLSYYIDNPDEITLYEKVRIIRQLAQALSAVHSKNILHRDIKPENILLSEALQVKVTDFGVCHLPTSAQMGFAEGIFGTPRYIAPEYFRKGRIDQRGDIYSLGVVAYELLLGTKPFAGLTLKELVRKTLKEYPEEPVKIDSEFPLPLQGILAKMLKKKPKRRYYEASEIIRDIDALCHKNSSALSFDALINVLERDWA